MVAQLQVRSLEMVKTIIVPTAMSYLPIVIDKTHVQILHFYKIFSQK